MLRSTRLDYCQYLLSTPLNYTLTHFAEHSESFSHDQINRYLAGDRLTPRMLWEHVKNDVVLDSDGNYLVFKEAFFNRKTCKMKKKMKIYFFHPFIEKRDWPLTHKNAHATRVRYVFLVLSS